MEDIAGKISVIFGIQHDWKDHVSPGSAETLVRGCRITNHHLIAYSLSIISAKNYRNRLMCVEVIVCCISFVYFETRCIKVKSSIMWGQNRMLYFNVNIQVVMCILSLFLVIDRVAGAIVRLVSSVCVCVRPFVCMRSPVWTVWPLTVIFGMWVDLDLG